jgi:hypothetical protein
LCHNKENVGTTIYTFPASEKDCEAVDIMGLFNVSIKQQEINYTQTMEIYSCI